MIRAYRSLLPITAALLLAIWLFPGTAAASAPDSLRYQSILDTVRAELKIPGASAVVILPDGRLWCGASGVAGVNGAATCANAFETGSITKSYTAALVLSLVKDGQLALDDSLTRWMPEFPHARGVTVRQLLQHTSGLYNYSESLELNKALDDNPGKTWTAEQLLQLSFKHPPVFKPGEKFGYSNTNTILLGLIAEQLEGKPLSIIMRDRLFVPLALQHTLLPPIASNAIPELSAASNGPR